MKPSLILPLLLLSTACDRPAPAETAPAAPVAATAPQPAAPLTAGTWTLPVTASAAQPDLVLAPDGALLLSWIEAQGDAHALKFARFADGAWGDVREIARGDDWFVNWADTPHLAVTADGALWAHWLQKSAAATYAYDVALVRSGDGGATLVAGRCWSMTTARRPSTASSRCGRRRATRSASPGSTAATRPVANRRPITTATPGRCRCVRRPSTPPCSASTSAKSTR